MVWDKINSGFGRLWVSLMVVVLWVSDWLKNKSQSRPGPLKGLSATIEGTRT